MTDRTLGVTGWVTAVVASLALVVLGLNTGGPELLAALAGGLGLIALRARLTAPYAFVTGQVTLVAAAGNTPSLALLLVTEAALLTLLFEPDLSSGSRRRHVPAAMLFGVGVGVVTVGTLLTWDHLWAASLVVVGTGGLIGYLLHRYEYVQLGVVSGE